jgi:ethanolamine transporter EutH
VGFGVLADDNRRLRYAVAIGFVSAVAVPIGLIFAFLSTSTSQVNKAWSMFSHHYLAMYLAVVAIIVIGALLWLGLLVQHRRDAHEHNSPIERPGWIAVPDEPPAAR